MAVRLPLKHTSRSYKPTVKLRALKRFTFLLRKLDLCTHTGRFSSDSLVMIARVTQLLRTCVTSNRSLVLYLTTFCNVTLNVSRLYKIKTKYNGMCTHYYVFSAIYYILNIQSLLQHSRLLQAHVHVQKQKNCVGIECANCFAVKYKFS